jgi:capsular polysaccharide biosynthesis protein
MEGQGFSGALYDCHGSLIRGSQRRSGPSEKVYTTDPDQIPVAADLPTWSGRGCYIGHVMRHYGHFITEGLSTLWPDDLVHFDYLVAHPFIWGAEIPAYAHEAMARLEIASDRIRVLTGPVRLESVAVPDRLWLMNASVNAVQRRVVSRIKRRFERPDADLKLYLSRVGIPRRSVPNEREIEEVFRRAGFVVIRPQNFGFASQLELYGQTRLLAGLAGSALHNVILCPRGAGVISVGDRRASVTRNQIVCGAFIDGPTGVIDYVDGPGGFDIPALRSELHALLEIWPDRIGG